MSDESFGAPRFRSTSLFAMLVLLVLLPAFALFGCGNEDPTPIPVILVPDEYPTPQAAMDAAEPGDLITVRPGIYTYSEVRSIDEENYPGGVRAALFMKNGVYIQGLGDERGQVILRDTTDVAFTVGAVFAAVGENTLIDNLSFEDYSVGVLMTGDSGQIQYSRISDCPLGVHAVRAAAPAVATCLILRAETGILSENVADGLYWLNIIRDGDVGIEVSGTGYARVPGNLLCRNAVGLRVGEGAVPDVWSNGIRDNTEDGVLLVTGANPVVVENDIYDNGVDFEVGIYETPLAETVYAIANYWASTDTLEIMEQILDRIDDPARGAVVEYKPASPVSRSGLETELDAFCGPECPVDEAALLRMLHEISGDHRVKNAPARPRDAVSRAGH